MIFDKRLEAKAAGNDGLQQAYKLLMNSSYGKLIEKTPTTDIRYKAKEDVLRYVESITTTLNVGHPSKVQAT